MKKLRIVTVEYIESGAFRRAERRRRKAMTENRTVTPPARRLVTLVQCCKSRCGHVLTEDEYVWIPDDDSRFRGSKRAVCPKFCGGRSFYTLNTSGQHRKSGDTGLREIDPTEIEPSPRLGLKMKRRLLAAKRRAIERNRDLKKMSVTLVSAPGTSASSLGSVTSTTSVNWPPCTHPLNFFNHD